ncbi:MAG: TIGR03761 family integrating conjugative element protein [Deltaproteobacteria bacterium]|nr:TIGR03761 family integrating conjugative element protein [Deltaproteobacteria bacterium]
MSADGLDVEAKLAQLKELKSQIEKLDELFERDLKAAGLTKDDLKKIDPKTLPLEFKKKA